MDQLFTFRLYYHTPPGYTSIYYSATTDPTWGNYPVSQTFSEPYFAHEWMPCKQELEDKADSVHIFITTSDNLRVAGPGLLTKVNLPDGKTRHEWRTNQLTAFYLIAFAISEYQEYALYAKPDSLINDSILILNYVYDYPNCLESNLANINQTKPMLELLSNFYGLYPFYKEKYGHYMWYPANFSGMEHMTMSGMRNFGYDLISHELGHSWFGNNVTCATWQDIWINEGFATYTEYIVRENLISKASADARMAAFHNTVLSQPAGSVYVPAASLTNWGRIFSTRLTYRKGGALVHMIRFEMQNDSLFYRTLYEFQQQYKDSIATGIEFRDMCQQVTGIDFTDFFDQWYFGEGHPIYSLDWWQDEDTLFMHVTQATSAPVTPLFKMLMEYRVEFASGDTIVRNYQLTNDSVFKFAVADEVTGIVIDPNNWVLNLVGNIRHLKQAKLQCVS
jgi:aminopeptidase N